MPAPLDFASTVQGSLLEGFYPKGWDFKRLDACCALGPRRLLRRAAHWHKDFRPIPVPDVRELDLRMGNAIADQILAAREAGQLLALILPVGPMGMYQQVVARIRRARVRCDHVTTFNMDEWADHAGNTFPGAQPGGFEHAMSQALFRPLGKYTVPPAQRHFATRDELVTYPREIENITSKGGRLVTVYGIGRTCHIAFWEPHIAGEFTSVAEWKRQPYRIGQALHPLTIEQNALHSFSSRFTLIPCWANTIGPGLFLRSDYCIGGADGAYPDRGAMWQGLSLCATLHYGTDPWIPSSWMPTLPGRLYFMKALAGPLLPEAH